MLSRFRSRVAARITLFALAAQLLPVFPAGAARAVKATAAFRTVVRASVTASEKPVMVAIPAMRSQRLYSVTISTDPAALGGTGGPAVNVAVTPAGAQPLAKELHAGDPDLYLLARPAKDGAGTVRIAPVGKAGRPIPLSVRVVEWNGDAAAVRSVAVKPNGGWRGASPMTLGRTVFGSGDLTPYMPAEAPDATRYYDATGKSGPILTAETRKSPGEDWLTFRLEGDRPKLVHFQIDLPERDNIPPDVSVFTVKDGAPVPVSEGMDPVSPPHEIQALPGNKFTTRVLPPGVYYVRVIANHPEWQLRTTVFDAPPYTDPARAVQAGMDYMLGAGDSWHGNTPRAGARLDRIATTHAETAQCVACHPTQFTVRGALTAMARGYRTQRPESLEFLVERLANNPRPFYGHPRATWARMISAAGNVTSRVADLVAEGEPRVGRQRSGSVQSGAAEYLKLYYKGRTQLPEDETNGNQPLVSQYEVLYHSWSIFKRNPFGVTDTEKFAMQLLDLLAQDRHKNVIDLCWQTVAMAKADKTRFAAKIKTNCERLLSLQREDGQWSAQLDPKSAPVEFQTGHALYTLAVSGYGPDHPQVKKGVDFLLARQGAFGGWFDPLQSYENFRTPFRETQFAVMALSELFPRRELAAPPRAAPDAADPVSILEWLDRLRGTVTPAELRMTVGYLASEEPLVRQQSAQALARVGDASTVKPLAAALGDGSKMVQRTAAAALRKLGNAGVGRDDVLAALRSADARAQWGAGRVFAAHFREMAADPRVGDSLLAAAKSPAMPMRLLAVQALGQLWQWRVDDPFRERALDAVLDRMAALEHPAVARAAREALYNFADENVRYLYNNWIPLLADPADRETAARAQQAQDEMIARKLAAALRSGNPRLRSAVLRGMGEFHLRNAREGAGRYARIGNDVETIRFSPAATKLIAPAVEEALRDPSPRVRQAASVAAFTLRDSGPHGASLALLRGLGDADPGVRAAASEFTKSLPVDYAGSRPQAAEAVASLLRSPHSEAVAASVDLLRSREGAGLIEEPRVREAARIFLASARNENVPPAVALLARHAALQSEPGAAEVLTRALDGADAPARQAALELVLSVPALGDSPKVAAKLDAVFRDGSTAGRQRVVDAARTAAAARKDVRVLGVLTDVLVGTDDTQRAAVLEIARKDPAVARVPAVRAALAELAGGANARTAQLAGELISLRPTGSEVAADRLLDYDYFKTQVMPVFAARSFEDGFACVSCHFNHNLFKAGPPGQNGAYTEAQVRETYRAALKVVNLKDPERSLLLQKPLASAATEGLVNVNTLPHGGGIRWKGPDDPAYRTILAWINGARGGTVPKRDADAADAAPARREEQP